MRITRRDAARTAGAAALAVGLALSLGAGSGGCGSTDVNACDPPEMCVVGCSGCPPAPSGGDIGGTACPVLGEHKDGYVCHKTIAGQFWGY